MKDIFYVFASVIVFTMQLIAQSGWYSQTPKPTGDNLSSVFYADNNIIWAVGDNGAILNSTDGGNNWTTIEIDPLYNLLSIQFIDEFNGAICGREIAHEPGLQFTEFGILLTTTDAGQSWVNKFRGSNLLNDVFFINSTMGWTIADSGKVFKTTDGGNNWSEYNCGINIWLNDIYFSDLLNGWLISYGYDGGIFKTTDGGMTWTDVSPSFENYFTCMNFINGTVGWFCGTEIYKTTDAGGSWQQLTSFGGTKSIIEIQFVDESNGWCCAYNFTLNKNEILKTNDGGVTWSTQYSTDIYLRSLHFIDNNVGSTVGSYGGILITSNGGNNWELKTEWIPISLQKVCFPSLNTGFTIGRKGSGSFTTHTYFTLKSTDGGTNWSICDSLPSSWFRDLFFINNNKGWIVGANFDDTTGIIRSTSDGGSSWVTQYITPIELISSIYFTDEFNGWATKLSGDLLHTTNGGNDWFVQPTGFSFYHEKTFFVNNNIGWVIGNTGSSLETKIIKTSDGGSSWQDVSPPNQLDTPYDIDFVNEQVGWVVGEHGIVLKTTDGGLTWNQNWPDPWPNGPAFTSVSFVNENIGWIITDEMYSTQGSTAIFYTTNGGSNWELQTLLEGTNGSIFFHDQNTGWFVGGNNVSGVPTVGYVHKTTTGGITFIESKSTFVYIPDNHLLSQNYPNPFNPSTKISWQVPVGSWQTLKVYDVLGDEVATLVDEYKPAGNYEVEWNASNYPSGIYFYQLKTERFVETKKMILMK